MKSETLADKECETKQSKDTALCDLTPDSHQLNPQNHLSKMLIPHGVEISLNHFKSVPCPQPGYPKDEIMEFSQIGRCVLWNAGISLSLTASDFCSRELTTDISRC